MIQLLCLIIGLVYISQRRKILQMDPTQFPSVPASEFCRWQTLELTSIEIFLWATWGTFFIGIALAIASLTSPGFMGFGVGQLLLLVLFLAGLVVSAIYGTKAARLKKKLGISLRKP